MGYKQTQSHEHRIRRQVKRQNCNDHELSEQVSDTKFMCPNCNLTKDIRHLDNDSRSQGAASPIETGRPQS